MHIPTHACAYKCMHICIHALVRMHVIPAQICALPYAPNMASKHPPAAYAAKMPPATTAMSALRSNATS